ncbi:efflux RND transporter periplasmic adaptor subunit [Muricauda sp. JGD-17]|uniref:Efflux RND transporter periplasmic adaptor subunit n=1 Tax=Flagellimonas ochracea TaxID=2696472 RepID=A0A964T9M8_9FLAO|nr:efflux RND transporter periplasmic adaptor subunit [Allomuricauda ochracea]NAY90793.1 efflux RND transporter periplasmic adaptor subunit [Allomuricauda ochracea]
MKQRIIYIGIAAIVGLAVGYLLFGKSDTDTMEVVEHDHNSETGQMWTCSMHPQIMQPEAGDCPICGMDLIPAEVGADGLSPEQFKMTKNALALANIQTTVVGSAEGDNDNIITLSGKIGVNEEAMAVQASYFDGRIERLNVNYEGQEIRKGQLLATIYSPELVAAQQELLTAASLRESQPQLYSAVRNKLKLWKLSDNQINNIESSGKVKENFPVYATVSGTVSEVMSSAGDYLKKGQPIAKVSDLSTVWAEFDAYESQFSQLKKGQKISIAANAYPNKTFDGQITFIDPVLDNTTRTVTVRATLRNQKDMFKPGMFVTGKIESGMAIAETTLFVPSSAVMWTGERSLVYVKVNRDEPIFEMREVMLGARNGENIEVTHGLDSGEEIVTNGTFTVDAAAQLQGKRSMMNKTGGKTMTGHEGHIGKQEDMGSDSSKEMMKMEFSDNFQKDFEAVLPAYLKLKDALVASDAPKTSMDANATLKILKKLDLSNTGAMEKAHIHKIIEMLEAIANKEDLENQRTHFVILNENMVAIASNLDSLGNTFYVQKCPMANNNKGAVWLSTENEIRNPYYGDAMLKCGSVVKIID